MYIPNTVQASSNNMEHIWGIYTLDKFDQKKFIFFLVSDFRWLSWYLSHSWHALAGKILLLLSLLWYYCLKYFFKADIFEARRDISLAGYGLDPAHFLTAPSLSWNAGFKLTRRTLDLMMDIEMVNFIDKGILFLNIHIDFIFDCV